MPQRDVCAFAVTSGRVVYSEGWPIPWWETIWLSMIYYAIRRNANWRNPLPLNLTSKPPSQAWGPVSVGVECWHPDVVQASLRGGARMLSGSFRRIMGRPTAMDSSP
jgi:hypothetical protein